MLHRLFCKLLTTSAFSPSASTKWFSSAEPHRNLCQAILVGKSKFYAIELVLSKASRTLSCTVLTESNAAYKCLIKQPAMTMNHVDESYMLEILTTRPFLQCLFSRRSCDGISIQA